MKRSATPIQFLASGATKTASMSSRSSYRGDTKQWGRGFSHCPYNQGRGQQFVTGDSLFQSVQDSNLGNGQAGSGGFDPWQLPPPPRFNPNQRFRQPAPFVQNQNQKHQFRRSSRFDHNSQAIRPPQQFRPRPPKPSDYRDWEYAKTGPPLNSEKFIVLSYNILADYLAINHRSKLYFHIPRYMLDWGWRKRSILFELNLWSADIMCLQEVDRFQDLAEDLKLRGYDGIWKMRTGNAIDGCAIFWRTSRFKLLYEEAIEFNKLGLRDNVAQICVLEHLTDKNCSANTSDVSIRSESSDKVVVCNIHVLFNPKRGEIKLGQVRTLLDKANAVAKMWNAPVVLCGDFNCTPKSPLYNFILEQKLELSGIDRDKVSGQASAEIRASNPNPNPNANPVPNWQKQNNPYKNEGTIPTTDGNSLLQSIRSILDVPDTSLSAQPSGKVDTAIGGEKTKATLQDVINNCKEDTASNISVLADSFNKDLTISHNECELPICQLDDVNCKSTSTISYDIEDSQHDNNQMQQSKSSCPPDQGSYFRHSGIIDNSEIRDPNTDKLAQPAEVPPLESFSYLSSQPIDSDENADLLAPSRANVSNIPLSISFTGKNELDDASPQGVNLQQEGEMLVEDQSVSLHDTKFSSQPDSRRSGQSDNQNEFASDSIDSNADSPDSEVLNDFSNDLDSDFAIMDRTAYDPSLWTPVEVAVATGNADCMFLEHPLKLKSSYAEVKDCSGTRDPNGEPLVTSYNRCFLGTVDYIWLSEGLQTVRVLAPLPKHAMQWTPGFPTKKWGSDHIALASEMAFTKDRNNKAMEDEHYKE